MDNRENERVMMSLELEPGLCPCCCLQMPGWPWPSIRY